MRTVDQITYQARTGSNGMIFETATSLHDQAVSDLWWRRLEPWLRIGKPESHAYLNFGTEAAFIRWHAEPTSHYDWEFAHVLAGAADLLTGRYALELVGSDHPMAFRPDAQEPLATAEGGSGRDAMESRARSADATEQLTPLLAHALREERRVTMPWKAPLGPEAVMWGLLSILQMIGETIPVSFLTYMSSTRVEADTAGLFVGFRPDLTAVMQPDPGFITLAEALTAKFAEDPGALRELLERQGMLGLPDRASRIKRLLELVPVIQKGGSSADRTTPANTAGSGSTGSGSTGSGSAGSGPAGSGSAVTGTSTRRERQANPYAAPCACTRSRTGTRWNTGAGIHGSRTMRKSQYRPTSIACN